MKTTFTLTSTFALLLSANYLAQNSPVNDLKNKLVQINKEKLRKDSSMKANQATIFIEEMALLKTKLDSDKIRKAKYDKKMEKLIATSAALVDTSFNETDSVKKTHKVCRYYYIDDSLYNKTCHDSTSKEAVKTSDAGKTKDLFFFKVYTDAKGFNKSQPNGLLQTSFGFNWDLQGNLNLKPILSSNTWTISYLKNLQLPNVNLFQNKRDSSFRYVPVSYDTATIKLSDSVFRSSLNVHTLNLIKYAHYSVSGKLNLFAFQNKQKGFSFFVDVYGTFYASGLKYDSTTFTRLKIKKEDAKFQVYSVGWGYNAKVIIKPPTFNFRLEASYSTFNLTLLNNDVKQSFGALYSPDYNVKNSGKANVENKKTLNSSVGIWSIEIGYSKEINDKNRAGTGLYFRLNLFTNPLF